MDNKSKRKPSLATVVVGFGLVSVEQKDIKIPRESLA